MCLVAALINSGVSANKLHFGLFNGSPYGLELLRVDVTNCLAAAVTGLGASFDLLRTTTQGTATPGTIRKLDDSILLPAGVVCHHTYTGNPTITANSELASAAVQTEETGPQGKMIPLFRAEPDIGIIPILIPPTQGILLRQSALASAGAVSIYMYFRKKNGGYR